MLVNNPCPVCAECCLQRSLAVQATEDIVQSKREGGSPAVAVVGSKGVGKSTVARLLVNSLLEVSPVVAFLDTDCGQSELTVPGQQPAHTSPLPAS